MTYAGKTWCYSCGRAPSVQGAQYVDSITLNVTCNSCGEPLRTVPKGIAWVYDEELGTEKSQKAPWDICLHCHENILCHNGTWVHCTSMAVTCFYEVGRQANPCHGFTGWACWEEELA